MSPYQYGLLAVSLSITSIAPLLVFLCINDSVYFNVIRKEENKATVISTAIYFELVFGVVLTAILTTLIPVTKNLQLFKIPYYPYVFFSFVASFFSILPVTYYQVLQAEEKGKHYSLMNLLFFAVSVGLTLVLLIRNRLGAMSFIYSSLISNGLFSIFFGGLLLRTHGRDFSAKQLVKMIAFSVPLIPHNLAHWIKGSMDKIFLSTLSTTSNAGIYQIAFSYGSLLQLFIGSFRDANNPRFFSLIDNNKRQSAIVGVLVLSVGAFSLIALLMSLFSLEIIHLLTTKDFHTASQYVPMICSALLFLLIYMNIVNVLFRYSSTTIIAGITLSSSIFSSILGYLFINKWHIYGAGLSMMFSNLIMSSIVYMFCQRKRKLSWPIVRAILFCFVPLVAYIAPNTLGPRQFLVKTGIFFLIASCVATASWKEIGFFISEMKNSHEDSPTAIATT